TVNGVSPRVVVTVPLSAGGTSVPAGNPAQADAVAPAAQYTAALTLRSPVVTSFETRASTAGIPPNEVALGAPVTGAPHQQWLAAVGGVGQAPATSLAATVFVPRFTVNVPCRVGALGVPWPA